MTGKVNERRYKRPMDAPMDAHDTRSSSVCISNKSALNYHHATSASLGNGKSHSREVESPTLHTKGHTPLCRNEAKVSGLEQPKRKSSVNFTSNIDETRAVGMKDQTKPTRSKISPNEQRKDVLSKRYSRLCEALLAFQKTLLNVNLDQIKSGSCPEVNDALEVARRNRERRIEIAGTKRQLDIDQAEIQWQAKKRMIHEQFVQDRAKLRHQLLQARSEETYALHREYKADKSEAVLDEDLIHLQNHAPVSMGGPAQAKRAELDEDLLLMNLSKPTTDPSQDAQVNLAASILQLIQPSAASKELIQSSSDGDGEEITAPRRSKVKSKPHRARDTEYRPRNSISKPTTRLDPKQASMQGMIRPEHSSRPLSVHGVLAVGTGASSHAILPLRSTIQLPTKDSSDTLEKVSAVQKQAAKPRKSSGAARNHVRHASQTQPTLAPRPQAPPYAPDQTPFMHHHGQQFERDSRFGQHPESNIWPLRPVVEAWHNPDHDRHNAPFMVTRYPNGRENHGYIGNDYSFVPRDAAHQRPEPVPVNFQPVIAPSSEQQRSWHHPFPSHSGPPAPPPLHTYLPPLVNNEVPRYREAHLEAPHPWIDRNRETPNVARSNPPSGLQQPWMDRAASQQLQEASTTAASPTCQDFWELYHQRR